MVFVLVVFSPPPPPSPPPPAALVAPPPALVAVSVAVVCCCLFEKREKKEVRRRICIKKEREKGQKSAPPQPKRGGIPPKGHFFWSREQNCEKNATLFLPPTSSLSFLLDEAKEFEYAKKQKRSAQIFARTHAPRLRAVLRSFLCLFVLVLLSRFFFPFVDKIPLYIPRDLLKGKKRVQFVLFFLFLSSSARHTRRP